MNNWIEWKGGACPVDGSVVVEVCFIEDTGGFKTTAGAVSWVHSGDGGDITSYRVVGVEETKPIDTPYQPEVGESCEHLDSNQRGHYGNLYYIGLDKSGLLIMEDVHSNLRKFPADTDFRPIKTDEELFVEKGMKINRELPMGVTEMEMFEALFKNGFTITPE